MTDVDVAVIGGGLAGLCCARELARTDRKALVLEAAETVGGRVRTDELDGFRLDRGFQVLLTAYPEARRVLDYDRLDLRPFYPGALVRCRGRFHRVADPFRKPLAAASGLLSPVGTLGDKLRVAGLRRRARRGSLEDLFARPETATIDALRTHGFTRSMIERFFRPFLGGVFLDPELRTSSRQLEFVMRMFAAGDTAVPALGMGEIPRQLADALPSGWVLTGVGVKSIEPGSVRLNNGERITCRRVVLAADAPGAARLLADAVASTDAATVPAARHRAAGDPAGFRSGANSVTCLYFAADEAPVREPVLVLNGEDDDGPVNNFCVPSEVSSAYAPPGASLMSATVLGLPPVDDARLEADVRAQLSTWFGRSVARWRHLRTYRISYAVPRLLPGRSPNALLAGDVIVCGDHAHNPSIQGAMVSGRLAAETLTQVERPV